MAILYRLGLTVGCCHQTGLLEFKGDVEVPGGQGPKKWHLITRSKVGVVTILDSRTKAVIRIRPVKREGDL